MHMVSAVLATIRRAAHYAIMLGDFLTVLAKDAIGIEVVLEPFQTGRVIGKLCLEGF